MKRLVPFWVFVGMVFTATIPALAASPVSSEGYLALVAEKNPELAASASRVESLYRLVEAVTGSTRPRLGLQASSGRILREGDGDSTLSMSLGKRLDLWGLDALRIRQAELAAQVQEARHEEFSTSLARDAETAYWNAAAGKSTVALYTSLLAQRQEDLRVARLRFEQGTAAKLDVFRAEVQVEKTRAAKTEAEAALRDALSLMARLAGGDAVEPSRSLLGLKRRFPRTLKQPGRLGPMPEERLSKRKRPRLQPGSRPWECILFWKLPLPRRSFPTQAAQCPRNLTSCFRSGWMCLFTTGDKPGPKKNPGGSWKRLPSTTKRLCA